MVGDGWAVSFGEYYQQEARAKKHKAGIWAGEFERPADWRKLHSGIAERSNSSGGDAWWRIW